MKEQQAQAAAPSRLMPDLDMDKVVINKKQQLNAFIRMFSAIEPEERAVSRSDGRGASKKGGRILDSRQSNNASNNKRTSIPKVDDGRTTPTPKSIDHKRANIHHRHIVGSEGASSSAMLAFGRTESEDELDQQPTWAAEI